MDLNFFGVWVPIAEYVLNADGQVLDELMGGYSRHWEYENGTTLPSTYTQLVDGSTSNTDLAYDRAGRLTTVVDNVASHTATYTYDLASQLLQATGSTPGSSDDWTYTYGDDGRRLTQTTFGGTTTYQHGPDGRIASATIGSTTTNYTYDKAGRLTSNGTHTFSYDPRGLLIEMNPTGNNLYDHRNYDGDGNLSEHDIGVTNVFEARMRAAAWDPTQPVINPLSWEGTLEVAGDPPTIYTSHSAHLYGRARIVTGQTGGTSWYGYDHLGSVIDTDTNDVPDRYSPYGQPLNVSFWPSYYGYRGEAQTHHTIHLRNRTYDPNTGQFITRDPLGDVDGTTTVANPYAYSLNDPLNRVDPLGLRSSDCDMDAAGCTYIVNDLSHQKIGMSGGTYWEPTVSRFSTSMGSAVDQRLIDTLMVGNHIASAANETGMDPFLVFAVSMNDIGGAHQWKEKGPDIPVIGDWDIPQCAEDMYNAHRGEGTIGITNMSLSAYTASAKMFPKLLESGGSIEDNWKSLACNERASVRSTGYYLKYLEQRYFEEIVARPNRYKIVTDFAYGNGPLSTGGDGYERDGEGHRLLRRSALMVTGYTRGEDTMVRVMRNTVNARDSNYGGPNGAGGAFNTVDLMGLGRQVFCGGQISYFSC